MTRHMTSYLCLIQELDSKVKRTAVHVERFDLSCETPPIDTPLPPPSNTCSSVDYLYMYGYVCTCVVRSLCALVCTFTCICTCMYVHKQMSVYTCSLATCIKCV